AAWTLWCLGYPDQGLTRSHEVVTRAQQMASPFSLAFALGLSAVFHSFRREVRLTQERAEAAISLATDQGFPLWRARGAVLRDWALVQQGQTKEELEQMYQSMQAFRATGAELARPYYLALLAETHGAMGQPAAGLAVLAEALTLTDTTGTRWCESELY